MESQSRDSTGPRDPVVTDGLTIGGEVGPYRIAGKLGAGGMGEVWRAEDTRLGRGVALKLLPSDFALDDDRHARFEREAKILASLNHSNIATLYGLEHLEDHHVLVMELVDGEDLEQRLRRGAVPVDEALAIATQVAEALEAAHEAGVIHRDLKPANVMLRPDGTVKVLDFGLAKSWETKDAASQLSMSPTLTSAGTVAGLILGTAGYMAPEQAKGKPVDRRADIWSFGVLLWEMLTGQRLFSGTSATEVLASVLRDPIDLAALPDQVPGRVVRLIGRCLDRDPRQRLQAIGEARIALASDLASDTEREAPEQDLRPRGSGWWVAALMAMVATVASVWTITRPTPPPPVVVTAEVNPPANTEFVFDGTASGSLSVSPDGRWITFSAAEPDQPPKLWVRPTNSTEARPLPGTEGAAFPFWAPSSREIAFFADHHLQRIALDELTPIEVCAAPDARGGTWGGDGTIVFSPTPSGGLHRVAAIGGQPEGITDIDAAAGEATHRWPTFLPDDRHVVFFVGGHGSTGMGGENALWVVDTQTGERKRLIESWSKGVFSNGHLLFGEYGALVARPFDLDRQELVGPPVIVASDIGGSFSYAVKDFGISERDVLVFRVGDSERLLQLRSVDLETLAIGDAVGEPVAVDHLSLSPDGRYLAMALTDLQTELMDLWVHDLERDVRVRLSYRSFPRMLEMAWSSDGQRIAYGVTREDGISEILITQIDNPGRSVQVVERTDGAARPMDWMQEDSHLLYVLGGGLYSLDLATGTSEEILDPEAGVLTAELSPDGRWFGYLAGVIGGTNTFVADVKDPSRRWQLNDRPIIAMQWIQQGDVMMVSPGASLWKASLDVEGDNPVIGRVELIGPLPNSRNGAFSAGSPRGVVAFTLDDEAEGQGSSPVRILAGWTARLEPR
jgi:serine/threonine protein kinase